MPYPRFFKAGCAPINFFIPCGELNAIETISPLTPTTTPSPKLSCKTLSPLFQDESVVRVIVWIVFFGLLLSNASCNVNYGRFERVSIPVLFKYLSDIS